MELSVEAGLGALRGGSQFSCPQLSKQVDLAAGERGSHAGSWRGFASGPCGSVGLPLMIDEIKLIDGPLSMRTMSSSMKPRMDSTTLGLESGDEKKGVDCSSWYFNVCKQEVEI